MFKQSETPVQVRIEFGTKMKMRDGIELSADIYRPDSGGKFPVILVRTCYGKNAEIQIDEAKFFASHGYAYVVQDVRGRYDADGAWFPFKHEAEDGYDSQDWCGRQKWSTGKVGTTGGSYLASTQWLSAPLRNSHVKAMVCISSPSNAFKNTVYQDGALFLGQATWLAHVDGRTNRSLKPYDFEKGLRHRPILSLDEALGHRWPHWREWLRHPTKTSYWNFMDYEDRFHDIDVPVLHISGWFDDQLVGTHLNFLGMTKQGRTAKTRKNQKLVIGPWLHQVNKATRIGFLDFGPAAVIDLQNLKLRWFDYWLKKEDNGIADEPPVNVFLMGKNVWREEKTWPPKRAEYVKLYLHSSGKANSLYGDGKLDAITPGHEPPDTFSFDPEYPVPLIFDPMVLQIGGPDDYRPIERRDDVLVYTSEPLKEPLDVTGPIEMTLYASSNCRDTDFTAMLLDVHPDGPAVRLCDGVIRARYRQSFRRTELLVPGQVYRFRIDLWATSNCFLLGHRIRVDISSSLFPKYDVNPNTGREIAVETRTRVARQQVCHDRVHPSHILLPIVKGRL